MISLSLKSKKNVNKKQGSYMGLCLAVILGVGLLFAAQAHAQGAQTAAQAPVRAAAPNKNAEPPLPKPLQTQRDEGAQIRYLGREYGMDAWLSIQRGREQYFYVTPKGDAMLMGLLFDVETGRLVTIDQLKAVQEQNGGVLDLFSATRVEEPVEKPQSVADGVSSLDDLKPQAPSELLFKDVTAANTVMLGDEGAPLVYAFIDPQCQYCHEFIKELRKDALPNGKVRVAMIPVGFTDASRAQAAFMLGAPDAAPRFLRHLDGDKVALPVSYELNQQGVERNMAIMQNWKLSVTPLIVYRGANGEVKIIQGRPKSVPALVSDIKK
jgi:thiol:disulfide interchange protein DsbG